ncbi:MAG: RsmB/NOP family class I SAM-dependent RNA methyltransferase [Peptostreptococcaceae bacterium]|nr:RsmB/NOP family class I SAM-dependent RNA methyltransferase [Peptostreptococcaceae bacterium]
MNNLPIDYIEKMQSLLGKDFDIFMQSYALEKMQGFRLNSLKIDNQTFWKKFSPLLSFDKEQVPWCPTGYYYPSDVNLSKSPLYHAGLYYLQEPSAMSVVEFLDVKPDMKVLDLCAAPGGKTVQIACKMKNTGLLVSNDISLKRTKAILKNIETQGIRNTIITNAEPKDLAAVFPEFFERILVDAPCSGEGMFRKSPELIKSYASMENITDLQRDILSNAAKMCCAGGRIIYSTCTFNREENEEIISDFLRTNSNFRLIDPFAEYTGARDFGFENGYGLNAFRLFPHKLKGEGHFLAILEKNDDFGDNQSVQKEFQEKNSDSQTPISNFDFEQADENPQPSRLKKEKPKRRNSILNEDFGARKSKKTSSFKYKNPQNKEASDFEKLLAEFEGEMLTIAINRKNLVLNNHSIYQELGFQSDLKNIRIIRNGLYLGDIKNQQFIPSPAFIMAHKKSDFKHSITFTANDPLLYKYLRCETIDLDLPDGYHVVCVDEYPLGLVKVKNKVAKNLYNQNWRLL